LKTAAFARRGVYSSSPEPSRAQPAFFELRPGEDSADVAKRLRELAERAERYILTMSCDPAAG